MADMDTLALSGLFAPQIQQNDTLQRYLRAYGRQPRPNAPKITQIRWVELEKWPPACRQASPSLSRRLLPAHYRRAEHSKLAAAGQRSALRRLWRAAHTCDMRCQGCVEPGVAPMAIPEPARGARNQHTRSVRDVVGIHCIGLR